MSLLIFRRIQFLGSSHPCTFQGLATFYPKVQNTVSSSLAGSEITTSTSIATVHGLLLNRRGAIAVCLRTQPSARATKKGRHIYSVKKRKGYGLSGLLNRETPTIPWNRRVCGTDRLRLIEVYRFLANFFSERRGSLTQNRQKKK